MNKIPLAVDLDGTLLTTDLLFESLLCFAKAKPLNFPRAVYWLISHDRAYMKARMAEQIDLDIAALPYHSELVAWLAKQKQQGRELYIATASHQKYAQGIAGHLELFTGVFASGDGPNLKGVNKASKLVDAFGEHGFDYAGDASIDLKVWSQARKAVVVSDSAELLKSVEQTTEIDRIFKPELRQASWLNALMFQFWGKLFH